VFLVPRKVHDLVDVLLHVLRLHVGSQLLPDVVLHLERALLPSRCLEQHPVHLAGLVRQLHHQRGHELWLQLVQNLLREDSLRHGTRCNRSDAVAKHILGLPLLRHGIRESHYPQLG